MAAVADRLPDELRERQAGKTEVRDVKVRFEEDGSGREALYLVLTLANPPRGQPTWPVDDLWSLRRVALETKTRLEAKHKETIDMPWYVVFEPEKPGALEDEDLREVVNLDE
ncbi:MAG TPA: hypothetical protein VGF15_00485 [Solirubrobacteraceae bacterium]|jgi:hypothetical protein